MPWDVSICWNSTFDMLDFAVGYQKAVEEMTSDRSNDLRPFELTEDEWTITVELQDTLQVRGTAYLDCDM